MSRVLTDFHHSSLLRSLVLLFEDRLGMELYRPIGMDWLDQGYWAINDQRDTAAQFLAVDSQPIDGTPALNGLMDATGGAYRVFDPGSDTTHRACNLEWFKAHNFDYLVASIPAHVPIFKELIRRYQPKAKLIIQVGNNWNLEDYAGENVLASIAPQPTGANAVFYHQEFDLGVFYPTRPEPNKRVYSFVNVIESSGQGWQDYQKLGSLLGCFGWQFRAYGGQCPDGNMTGPAELAAKMREAMMVFHVKPGGDGFGHIIHNAYAVGRPLITRPSYYRGQLAEALLIPGTYIDLDEHPAPDVANMLKRLSQDPERLAVMGEAAAERFRQVVNYQQEAEAIQSWLSQL